MEDKRVNKAIGILNRLTTMPSPPATNAALLAHCDAVIADGDADQRAKNAAQFIKDQLG